MIKACIIGISSYGRIHYELLMAARQAGRVEIAGAAVINQDEEIDKCRHLRELGCRIFDDYQVMLKELAGTVDLCCIPTGTPLHRPMTVAALEAGMHVFVEKPVAGCLEDAQAMEDAASKADRIVAVGYQHLYAPAAMATKRHILNETIGKLESIKCLVTWPRDHAYYNRNGWAGKMSVDGTTVNDSPFNNAVAHELMMMLFLAGSTERQAAMPVSVEAELYRANAIESADTASLCVKTAEDVPIRFYCTHACQTSFGPEIHIRGTKGKIVMCHNGSTITQADGTAISLPTDGDKATRAAMMSAVLDAVQGERSFYCDARNASRQTMVVDMIHRACRIQSVSGVTKTMKSGQARTVIPGVEEIMRKAFDGERLFTREEFSAMGVSVSIDCSAI